MSDAENSDTVVSVSDMLTYLNLDDTEENNTVLSGLIDQATDFVNNGFNSENLSASDLKSDDTYILAVKALTASLFYDRTMSQGVPIGVQMALTRLQGRYDRWVDKQD